MSKILVVDDEAGIRDIIKEYLQFEGYEYKEAENGIEALDILKKEDFDLVVLDIMMPKLDGVTVLKEMRKMKDIPTPVIMLTARGEEYDKLFGFELGADDYMVKPFSPRELMARIKSVLRRAALAETSEQVSGLPSQLSFDQLVIDVAARDIYIDGEKLSVTPKEFDLLLYLARNKNIVLSRNQILSEVWGYDFFGDDRTVDTHIKMLRSSMGTYRDVIKTVWGIGYKFEL